MSNRQGRRIGQTGWRSTKEIANEIARQNAAEATPKQQAVIKEFCEIVDSWSKGEMPLEEAIALTGDGWLRSRVILCLPSDHPSFEPAMRFLDAVIARQQGGYQTKHGWFSQDEIDEYGGRHVTRVDPETGEILNIIQFPIGVNKSNGEPIWPQRQDTTTAAKKNYLSPYVQDWVDE